jgi:hypothetical protein
MSRSSGRPVLFLDVDGTLITFKARPGSGSVPGEIVGNPLLERLEADDGRRLRQLECDLVWATTWGEDANEVVAPRLGLPPLPVVEWPDENQEEVARGLLTDADFTLIRYWLADVGTARVDGCLP